MPPTTQAIETRYAGCQFRSRLEARWAVFYDSLKIPWHYEPEGFKLASGWYLPDFWLPTVNGNGVWFEVKPSNGTDSDPRWPEFAWGDRDPVENWDEDTARELIVAFGMPRPDGDLMHTSIDAAGECFMVSYYWGWDNCRAFCTCKCGATIGVQWDGIGSRNGCPCTDPSASDYYGAHNPRIIAAYAAARSARFERAGNPS